MNIAQTMDIAQIKAQMKKAIEHLDKEYAGLQVGRASTGLLEGIDVYIPSYGMSQKMNQVANISVIDAQTLRIEPWDKSVVSSVEKAIYDSGIGLTPQGMGDHLLIKVPPLTEERRREIGKMASKLGEEAKVSVRSARHDSMKDAKKAFEDKTMSEDERKVHESNLDEITKEYTTKIDAMIKQKEADIMKV